MKFAYELNGRPVPPEQGKALVLAAFGAMTPRETVRRSHRPETTERRSVAQAMLMVEIRLVKAFWILALSTRNPLPTAPQRHGLGYMFEQSDQDARYADAASKNWASVSPKPALPSGKEIDAADEALDWLRLIDRCLAEIVSAGARSKRGDIGRRINWVRVRLQYPQLQALSSQRLRRSYQEGIRQLSARVRA